MLCLQTYFLDPIQYTVQSHMVSHSYSVEHAVTYFPPFIFSILCSSKSYLIQIGYADAFARHVPYIFSMLDRKIFHIVPHIFSILCSSKSYLIQIGYADAFAHHVPYISVR